MVTKLNANLATPGSPSAEADLNPGQLANFRQTHIFSAYGGWHFFQWGDESDSNAVEMPNSTMKSPAQLWSEYQASLPDPGEARQLLRAASEADIAEIKAILGIA
jgi:hypothetical protein